MSPVRKTLEGKQSVLSWVSLGTLINDVYGDEIPVRACTTDGTSRVAITEQQQDVEYATLWMDILVMEKACQAN